MSVIRVSGPAERLVKCKVWLFVSLPTWMGISGRLSALQNSRSALGVTAVFPSVTVTGTTATKELKL